MPDFFHTSIQLLLMQIIVNVLYIIYNVIFINLFSDFFLC